MSTEAEAVVGLHCRSKEGLHYKTKRANDVSKPHRVSKLFQVKRKFGLYNAASDLFFFFPLGSQKNDVETFHNAIGHTNTHLQFS